MHPDTAIPGYYMHKCPILHITTPFFDPLPQPQAVFNRKYPEAISLYLPFVPLSCNTSFRQQSVKAGLKARLF